MIDKGRSIDLVEILIKNFDTAVYEKQSLTPFDKEKIKRAELSISIKIK